METALFAPLAIAALAFLATHLLPSSLILRPHLVRLLGENGYLAAYSLLALATFGWLVFAYGQAPHTLIVWTPGLLHFVPLLLMPFALWFILCGVAGPNPTSVKQEQKLAEAEPASGMLRVTRHPVQWGIALFAFGHLLANGDLASLIFFGALMLLAVLGMLHIDQRKAATLGEPWQRFVAATSVLPLGAIMAGRNRFVFSEVAGWRLLLAGAIYLLLLFAHHWLFGVIPY